MGLAGSREALRGQLLPHSSRSVPWDVVTGGLSPEGGVPF